MPRVGNYTYPLFKLSTLLKETKTLHEKFGTKEFTKDHVAQVLGQKSTSGGLSQKLADLKAYGLISSNQGRFTVTDIGIKATFGSDSERIDSLDKAVRNVSLWRAVYEKCGKDPLPDTFNLELAEITGITRPESQTVADTVRKSYIDDAKYLIIVKTPVKEPEPENPVSGHDPAPARGRNENMGSTQTISPVLPSIKMEGTQPILYDPELGASIVIDTPRKFQVAKIFWEAIAAKWERNGSPEQLDEKPTPKEE
jgi:hypothetical protein